MTISQIALGVGPIVLACMGVAVALVFNIARRRERWVWAAAFLIVGGLTSWATLHEMQENNEQVKWSNDQLKRSNEQIDRIATAVGVSEHIPAQGVADDIIEKLKARLASDIVKEMKGGDSICYWYVDIDSRTSDGSFRQIIFQNTGSEIPQVSWWVYEPGADFRLQPERYYKGPYAALHGSRLCPVSGFAAFFDHGLTLKSGAYAIDFTGSNGTWRELLVINETNAEITEEVTVTKPEGGTALVHRTFHVAK